MSIQLAYRHSQSAFGKKLFNRSVSSPTPSPTTPATVVSHSRNSLVIGHGLLGNKNNWNTVGNLLLARSDKEEGSSVGAPIISDIYQLDMRNHGDSPHTTQHNTWDMSSDIERVSSMLPHQTPTGDTASPIPLPSPTTAYEPNNKVILIGHSMSGIALMHSIFRQGNKEYYLNNLTSPTTPYEIGIRDSMEGVEEWRKLCLTGGNTPNKVAGNIIVDIVPFQHRTDNLIEVDNFMAQMKSIRLKDIKSFKEADAALRSAGCEDSLMRQFLLTNLKQGEGKNGDALFSWKCNLEVLHRDIHNIVSVDELPCATASGSTAVQKVDISSGDPLTRTLFIFGGKSNHFKSEDHARSQISHYFSGLGDLSVNKVGKPHNSNVILMPECGHSPHYESPKEFVECVWPFIVKCFQ